MFVVILIAPHGAAWVLLALSCVIAVGPWLAERARIPGILGLLAGGLLIGPRGLDIVTHDNTSVAALGQIGLLYLMFLAGVELDLGMFRRLRRSALAFGTLTFSLPMVLTMAAMFLRGFDTPAALLMGSLCASHTLVTYPVVRGMGLSHNRAVATTVAATVLTDTLALLVLAGVSGSVTGETGGAALILQLGVGIVALLVWTFAVLPRVGRWFFTGIGQERTLRFIYVLVALTSAAVFGEAFGIDGIVGAFFAGLGMNRLVPNRAPLMEKIEFFGAALFIPIFLISVGLLINPAVMVRPTTLTLAAVITVTCLGGKALAAVATRWLFGFTGAEASLVYALSSPQAAATLAATIVGHQIGLFSDTVVNAVLVLIVVSLVVASLTAAVSGRMVPRQSVGADRLGRTVVLALGDEDDIVPAARVAARLAEADGGLVVPARIYVPTSERARVWSDTPGLDGFDAQTRLAALASTGIDAEILVHADRSVPDGIAHTVNGADGSLLVLGTTTAAQTKPRVSRLRDVVSGAQVPVVTVYAPPESHSPVKQVAFLITAAGAHAATLEISIGAQVAELLRRTGLSVEVWAAADSRLDEAVLEPIRTARRHEWNGALGDWLATRSPGTGVLIPMAHLHRSALHDFSAAGGQCLRWRDRDRRLRQLPQPSTRRCPCCPAPTRTDRHRPVPVAPSPVRTPHRRASTGRARHCPVGRC